MNKEQLKALGLEDDVISKVITLHKETLDGNFVTKEAFEAQSEKVKKYATENSDLKDKLDEVSKSSVDVDSYKDTIKALKAELSEQKANHLNEIKSMQTNNYLESHDVIKSAFDKSDIISALDFSKFEYDDNGNITAGLDEQLEAIKEKKPHYWPSQSSTAQQQEKPKLPFNIHGKVVDEKPGMSAETNDVGMEFAKQLAAQKAKGISQDVLKQYNK